ncbi:hypothetical protein E2C01_002135 [Portunus trituberculatus]|uniref:Uncharacterized protein n=1 Tax=Portunus trituberculatus TaxID=210409 RepID=A0A5B7CIK6_PORTR|nr:hypothetical protein [Portunus trituberculatus]
MEIVVEDSNKCTILVVRKRLKAIQQIMTSWDRISSHLDRIHISLEHPRADSIFIFSAATFELRMTNRDVDGMGGLKAVKS